jgi:hypothetical protein
MVTNDAVGDTKATIIPMTVSSVRSFFIPTFLLSFNSCLDDPIASSIIVSSSCLPVNLSPGRVHARSGC